jgi:hypothetical protein
MAGAGLLLATTVAAAPPEAGPPSPLEGVPLDFVCDAHLEAGHPLLARQPGQDLRDLTGADDVDLEAWLQAHLCDMVWQLLANAGAHLQPDDVRLPARAVLQVELAEAELEGTRIVDQRVGSTVMPVAVPHWALDMTWMVRFSIRYLREGQEYERGTPMELAMRQRAEQEDYTPLHLGALLRGATQRAFRDLPRVLADEGGLGDLLFGVVDSPGRAPSSFGVSGPLAEGFWNLLAPRSGHRHDALAFYLASSIPPRQTRIDLARWFVLNDSDVAIRRDALAWLMQREGPADAEEELSADTEALLRWLLTRDPSPRMRGSVTEALIGRTGHGVRELLLLGSSDRDRRVSDVANTALRKFKPATAAEMAALDGAPAPPHLAGWTTALDGRIVPPAGSADLHLLTLARSAGGPAAETWIARWLRFGEIAASDVEWALPGWRAAASEGSPRIRREALDRLAREVGFASGAEAVLVDRIRDEADPELRVLAIDALVDREAPGATDVLLAASSDEAATVRATAALALADVPDPRAQARLEELAEDPDPKVRRKAKRALRKRSR